jgi:uncharacterized membrane protein YdfJ with MMPL/SSD domain
MDLELSDDENDDDEQKEDAVPWLDETSTAVDNKTVESLEEEQPSSAQTKSAKKRKSNAKVDQTSSPATLKANSITSPAKKPLVDKVVDSGKKAKRKNSKKTPEKEKPIPAKRARKEKVITSY